MIYYDQYGNPVTPPNAPAGVGMATNAGDDGQSSTGGPLEMGGRGFAPGGYNPYAQFMQPPQQNSGGGDPVSAMLAANPGMQPWVAQAYAQNGITPSGRGSGAGDWQYWQNEALNGAHGDTGYIAGRIQQEANGGGGGGGGGGSFGGGNNYTPLAPFQYDGGNFSSFSAPGVNAPAAFNYGGPQLHAPTPFGFPGVYRPQPPPQAVTQQQQPQPRQSAPAASSAPPPLSDAQVASQGWSPQGWVKVAGGYAPPDQAKNYAPADAPQSAPQDAPQIGTSGGPQDAMKGQSPAIDQMPPAMTNGPQGQPQIGTSGRGNDSYYNQPQIGSSPGQQPGPSIGVGDPNGPPQIGTSGRGSDWYYNGGQEPPQIGTNPDPQGRPPIGVGDPNGNGMAPAGIGTSGATGSSGGGSDWYYNGQADPSLNRGGNGGPTYQQDENGLSTRMPGGQGGPQIGSNGGGNTPYQTYRPAQPYQPGEAFKGGPQANPGTYTPAQPFSYQPPPQIGRYQAPQAQGPFTESGKIDAGTPFAFDQLSAPSTYTPGSFNAPTAEEAQNDPGYQFRLKQGADALQQSSIARGNLLTTGTARALNDYGQQAASQEYGNVYGRRFGEFQQSEAEKAGAAAFNADNARLTQGQNYGQAANTYGMNTANRMNAQQQTFGNQLGAFQANANVGNANEVNRLNAFQADTSAQLGAQAQGFGQAATTAQMNEANRLNAFNTNANTSLAALNQNYQQGRDTYALNQDNRFRAASFNEGNRQTAFGLNQGAQNQAFNQSLGSWQANNAADLAYQGQAWQQQYAPWAQNASNALSAGQTSAQLAAQTNALNAQQEQQRYQNAWNTYQSQVQQNQYGAGMGLNWAQLGLQQQGQNFNQNLASYNTNQNTIWGNQDRDWSHNFSLAQLGAGAAGGLDQGGQNYANNAGNLYAGIGNVQGAGQVGAGNAWANLYGNLGQTGLSGLNYYFGR